MSGRVHMGAAVTDAAHWSEARVAQWLEGQGLKHLVPTFEQNGVDGATLIGLEKNDLREELAITSLGDRKSVWEALLRLKEEVGAGAAPAKEVAAVPNTAPVPMSPPRPAGGRSSPVPSRASPPGSAGSPGSAAPGAGGLSPPPPTFGTTALPSAAVSQKSVVAESLHNLPPWRGGPMERCEECFKPFRTDIAVRVALPGATRPANVHRHCRDAWTAKNAKKCQYCLKLMVREVLVLSGGAVGHAEVHPECAAAFEARRTVRESPRTNASYTPRTFTPRGEDSVFRDGMGTCDQCKVPFTTHDAPVVLQLPGQTATAKLHPHCKPRWVEANAQPCDHCGRAMPTDVVQLMGDFGKGAVHPNCVEAFKASVARGAGATPPPRSTPPALPRSAYATRAGSEPAVFSADKYGACDHCGVRFVNGEDKVTLTLPGNNKAGTLHQRCKAQWAALNAAKCQHCVKGMAEDIVTLTGPFGSVDVHPECVEAYKAFLARGDPAKVAPHGCVHCGQGFTDIDKGIIFTLPGEERGVELHNACKAVWVAANAKRCSFCNEAVVKQQTTLTGPWGTALLHPECVESFKAGKSERCDYCFKVFEAGTTFTRLTLPGGEKPAKLHVECEQAYSRLRAKLCDHCKAPMTSASTSLSGGWGSAEVHPECVDSFKNTLRPAGAPAPPAPRSSGGYTTSPTAAPLAPPSEDACYQCKGAFGNESITMLRVSEMPFECPLHMHCIENFHKSLGHICAWCDRVMTGHMTELRGDFGTALLHPDSQCLQSFKRERNIA